MTNTIARLWTLVVDGIAVLGTIMIGVLMLIICSDVVARNLLGSSLPLVSELGALTLVMIVFLQLGTTVRHARLSRTEFIDHILNIFHPGGAALLIALFDIVAGVMCSIMAMSTWDIFIKDLSKAEFIGIVGVATLPTWPFLLLILVGISVAALQFFIQSVTNVRNGLQAGKGEAS